MTRPKPPSREWVKLRIIDGIGPFFHGIHRRRINWSKIPFAEFEPAGGPDPERFVPVLAEFDAFAARAAALGFNAVSLDDVAHLACHPDYPRALADRIDAWRGCLAPVLDRANAHGLTPYITTDVMFAHPAIPERALDPKRDLFPYLAALLRDLLTRFPAVGGVIVRIGECDGVDVRGEFHSRVVLRRAAEVRHMLLYLLPLFEATGRHLILRTWTVGQYPVGDLQWNRNTFDAAFGGVDSPSLILSMKYGESDFFRYLPVNKLFFRSAHRKVVEFQTRREYEGFGQYPSFVGWDYEHILRELSAATNLVGAMVWCQTGGWSGVRRRTFIDPDAVWNELNTVATAKLLNGCGSTEEALTEISRELALPGSEPASRLITLMRLSDEVVKTLLYNETYARRKLFFRRVRVPPLISVYWDHIIITHSMRKLMRCLVPDGDAQISQARAALAKIRRMEALAVSMGLPAADIAYQYDTFRIMAVARTYYFQPFSRDIARQLMELRRAYQRQHAPPRYTIVLDFTRFRMPRARLHWILSLTLRDKRGYRAIDRIVFIRLMALLAPFARLLTRRLLPAFADRQAMGIETLFK